MSPRSPIEGGEGHGGAAAASQSRKSDALRLAAPVRTMKAQETLGA